MLIDLHTMIRNPCGTQCQQLNDDFCTITDIDSSCKCCSFTSGHGVGVVIMSYILRSLLLSLAGWESYYDQQKYQWSHSCMDGTDCPALIVLGLPGAGRWW